MVCESADSFGTCDSSCAIVSGCSIESALATLSAGFGRRHLEINCNENRPELISTLSHRADDRDRPPCHVNRFLTVDPADTSRRDGSQPLLSGPQPTGRQPRRSRGHGGRRRGCV